MALALAYRGHALGIKRMRNLPKFVALGVVLAGTLPLAGCGPEEGSKKWCDKMANTPRVEWTPHQEEVYNDKCAAHEIQNQINKLLTH
jgi:hypothetical protein